MKVEEALKINRHIDDFIHLARLCRDECAPHLPFEEEAVLRSFGMLDDRRENFNAWLCYTDAGEPIGYGVAQCTQYLFNNDVCAQTIMFFVVKEQRGTWAYIKLMKAFEEWAQVNGALQIFAGVDRLDADEARHIRKLFPKMGYQWCGTHFVKEPRR